jgi:hypothetical protein
VEEMETIGIVKPHAWRNHMHEVTTWKEKPHAWDTENVGIIYILGETKSM